MKKSWVYILKCNDGTYYTGSTSNIEQRIYQHENKTYSGYTSSRLPIRLEFSQEFENIEEALKAERMIKKWSAQKKQALISNDYDFLHQLSECRNKTHHNNKD